MKVILGLKNEDEEIEVTIDLTLSSHQNIKKIYDNRLKLISKAEKTEAAALDALKKAKSSAIAEIKNKKIQLKKKQILMSKKTMWFEKFFWFISSENYLVISARDFQQNEIIIKKYVGKDDAVFHADIHGSAFTIVKNNSTNQIPPITLNEAAIATLGHSKAWDLKVQVNVYWVYQNQISKSAPTGMSLPAGSFMIYGKKNYIQPFKMEMGFALMFRVDEESALNHKGERQVKVEENLQQTIEISDDKLESSYKKDQTIEAPIEMEVSQVVFESKKKIANKQTKSNPQNKEKNTQDEKVKAKNKSKKNEMNEIPTKNEIELGKESNTKGVAKVKKVNNNQKKKLSKYMDKYGDEPPEEKEIRLKYLGIQESSKLKELQKKEFIWNNNEDEPTIVQADPEETKQEKELQEIKPTNKLVKETKIIKNIDDKIDEDEDIQIDDFNNLVGITLKSDTIYDVIPVCGPYMSFSKYKYKAKLLPGTGKRGKILKACLDMFLQEKTISEVF